MGAIFYPSTARSRFLTFNTRTFVFDFLHTGSVLCPFLKEIRGYFQLSGAYGPSSLGKMDRVNVSINTLSP